jgi:copper chaperone CopZ
MKCQGCVDTVKKALTKVHGAADAEVDLASGVVSLQGDVDPQSVCQILTEAGYPAVVKSR